MRHWLIDLVAWQDRWARPFGEFNHRWLSALFRPDPPGQGLPERDVARPPDPPGGHGRAHRGVPRRPRPRHRRASRTPPSSPSSSAWWPSSRRSSPASPTTPTRTGRRATRATTHGTIMVVAGVRHGARRSSDGCPASRTRPSPRACWSIGLLARPGRRLRRRRPRVRPRQHGQPPRVPRRRDEVDRASTPAT